MTPKLLKAKALDNYKIELVYENGQTKVYDMTELLRTCEFYKNLKDKEKFKKMNIVGLSIMWEDGEDIAPELLYEDSVLKDKSK